VHSNKGKIRIIGGEYRGRRLPVADRPGLRPTPDRVRETLFNWLGQTLAGLSCLDLFAGSGALGFEAASRGAKRVVMVEQDRAVFQSLQKTRDTIGAHAVEVVHDDAFAYLRKAPPFDIVFLDPPFRQNALPAVFRLLKGSPGMRVYAESSEPFSPEAPWRELKRSRAGQVSYQLFEWRSDDQGGLPGDV
jgi:16S rRNA (guanine966-N2)-methyltransferase